MSLLTLYNNNVASNGLSTHIKKGGPAPEAGTALLYEAKTIRNRIWLRRVSLPGRNHLHRAKWVL